MCVRVSDDGQGEKGSAALHIRTALPVVKQKRTLKILRDGYG